MRTGHRVESAIRRFHEIKRPRSSRMALISIWAMMALAVIAMPMMSFGAEVDRGQDLTIEAGETVREDAYLLGGTVDFKGRAEKDVFIAAGDAEIPGTIIGSLNLAVGQATVSGRVGGSLRIAGGTVEVTADVTGDLIVAGGRVTIPSRAKIGGDLILAGGQVDVRGEIAGDITGYAGRLMIAGSVNGDVDVNVGSLEVRSTADINGDLTYRSSDDGDVSSGADIGGTVTRPSSNPWDSMLERGGFLGPLLRAVWSLLVGAALILIAPRIANALAANAGRPFASAGVGVLTIWLIPVVAIILLVTLIGLPLGALLLVLFVRHST